MNVLLPIVVIPVQLRYDVRFIIEKVLFVHMNLDTVKSRAVDRSTIKFFTIFGVLLTETCY